MRAFGRDLSLDDGTIIGARAHLGHGGNLPIIMPAYLLFGIPDRMSMQANETERGPQVLRRNAAAFVIDYAFFGMGLAFAGTSTTLPALAARLTSNAVLIGLVGALWNGG